MLAFAFFASVFSTLMWLIYMGLYIQEKLGGIRFSSLGLLDLALYVSLLILPVFVLWMIFGYINQYINYRNLSSNMFSLFKQMKKNQDYTDLIARIMLEAEQEIKDGFILNKFDLFIADMNELLAETIQRGSLAAPEQIDRLWAKVNNGGKWAFGKVIIEVNSNQENFGTRIVSRASADKVLAGTILEFCARYQNLLNILEKHDKERIFLAAVETGVYGKVYTILAPLAERIRKERTAETVSPESRVSPQKVINDWEMDEIPAICEEASRPVLQPSSTPTHTAPHYHPEEYEERKSFIEVFNPFKRRHSEKEKDEPLVSVEKDPFSMALERSFGSQEDDPTTPTLAPKTEEPKEVFAPKLEHPSEMPEPHISEQEFFVGRETNIQAPQISSNIKEEPKFTIEKEIGFTHTQKALNTLKKEWEEMKETRVGEEMGSPQLPAGEEKDQASSKSSKDEDFAYPFGGWTDVDNYRK